MPGSVSKFVCGEAAEEKLGMGVPNFVGNS